ncbi:MAG: class I SAM-dependent methyltransferase [Ignavibacteriales bacterium]
MSLEEARKLTHEIDGWLSDKEGTLLYSLAKKCTGRGIIVEIGSWKGKSTVWLSKGSDGGKNITVYAVDPHTGSLEHRNSGNVWTFEEFQKNIIDAGMERIVTPLLNTSEEAIDLVSEPVELLFIDGCHEYEEVKRDLQLWFPKVVDGGTIAFHDTTTWDGPKKVVSQYVYKSKHFRNIHLVDSITYAEKVFQYSNWDFLKNRINLFIKHGYDLKISLYKSFISLKKLFRKQDDYLS